MAQIIKRKTGYVIRVSCGYTADGRQITQSMTWKPQEGMTPNQIKKALQKAAFEFEQNCEGGQVVNAEKFETFCETWFDLYAVRALKKSNIELCRSYTGRVYEKLGHCRIDRITPRDIDSFIVWLSKQEKKTGVRAVAKAGFGGLMADKRLNQKQLSQLAGVNPHTVKAARTGEHIKWLSAEKIAAALGRKTRDVFERIKSEKLLSSKTIKNYASFVSSVFDYAVRIKVIKENPCKNATLPKIPRRELVMFTLDEAKLFLDILDRPETPVKYRAFFQLAIFGGFRRGEILALEWRDIDLDTNLVHIKRTVHYSKKFGYYDTEPKSRSSVRTMKLPDTVIFTVKQLRNEQLSTRIKVGDQWHETERLFTTWNGRQMSGSAPTSWLIKTCQRNCLPKVNLHSMRHLNASLLISSGVDVKTVQSILGHSQASTTLDIYAAAFRDREAQALGAVAEILTGGRDKRKINA